MTLEQKIKANRARHAKKKEPPRKRYSTPHFSKLKADKVNILVPTRIIALITGALYAKQFPTGEIELIYTDESTESVESTLDLERDFENFFAVVDYVQSKKTIQ